MKNLIIAAVLLLPAAAQAQGNIKFGNLEVNPFVSTNESYDSNIYLTQTERKSALINRSAAGVDLLHKLGSRYSLKGGYNLELLGYSRETEINNATHHNAYIGAAGKLPKDVTMTVDNKWKQTTDQATSQLVERAERIENTMGVNVNAPLRGKFGFNVGVQHVYNNYMDSGNSSLDREELLAGFDIDYKWQPKTKFFFSYRHGILNYQEGYTNDATYENLEVGAVGNIGAKLTGIARAGVQLRNYEEDLGNAKNDATTPSYSLQGIWKPMDKTEVSLLGKRANVETTFGDARYYTSTLTDINVTREVNKVKVGLGLGYEDVRYSDEFASTVNRERVDENATVRLTAEYNIQKWLKADFGYTYKDRSSNFDQYEYKDNILALGLKATF